MSFLSQCKSEDLNESRLTKLTPEVRDMAGRKRGPLKKGDHFLSFMIVFTVESQLVKEAMLDTAIYP